MEVTYGYRGVGTSVVDQFDDGVGVVREVGGEVGISLGIAVGGDRLFEVVGDGLGIGVAQAGRLPSWPPVGSLATAPTAVAATAPFIAWCGESTDGEQGGGGEDGGEGSHGCWL